MNGKSGINERIVRSVCAALIVCVLGAHVTAGERDFGQYYEPYVLDSEPNAPGYTLPLEAKQITHFEALSTIVDIGSLSSLVQRNGFAIAPPLSTTWLSESGDDIVEAYRHLKSYGIPFFVTSDTLLHLYHIQFDETLKDVEEREFIPDIEAMTSALRIAMQNLYEQFEGDLQEAARRNIAFLAVAQKLLRPNWSVSPRVAETVDSELAKIEAREGREANLPRRSRGYPSGEVHPSGHEKGLTIRQPWCVCKIGTVCYGLTARL